MPGGGLNGILPQYFTKTALTAAINSGSIQAARVTEAAGRILFEMDRFGLLTGNSKHTVTAETTAANQRTVLQTAQDSATLLQNTGNTLPLSKTSLSSLAVIGPGGGQTIATNGGGEVAGGLLDQQVSALTTLRNATKGQDAHIDYAVADDLTGTRSPHQPCPTTGRPGCCVPTTAATPRRSMRS